MLFIFCHYSHIEFCHQKWEIPIHAIFLWKIRKNKLVLSYATSVWQYELVKYTPKILFFLLLCIIVKKCTYNSICIYLTLLAKMNLIIINQDLQLFINRKFRKESLRYISSIYLSNNFNELSNNGILKKSFISTYLVREKFTRFLTS